MKLANLLPSALVAAGVFVLAAAQVAGGAVPYIITDLGTLGGSRSSVDAINSLGQVVGHSTTGPGSEYHAYLYTDGVMHDLGTLGGKYSWAYAINDRGQIVGSAWTPDGNSHAFLYNDGVMQDLGTLGGDSSSARGINDAGQIVGWSKTVEGVQHAFLYSDGVMHDLGTLGGPSSAAVTINNAGVIVGSSDTGTGRRAFVYEDGVMRELGPGQWIAGARDINDAGQIALEVRSEPDTLVQRAFIYEDGAFDQLPLIGHWTDSLPEAINNRGEVVGGLYLRLYDGPYRRVTIMETPFIYTDGELWELNDLIAGGPVGSILLVDDINDSGLIVGKGNNYHAVLLTPVPGPGAAALLAVGGLLLAARKRRRPAI